MRLLFKNLFLFAVSCVVVLIGLGILLQNYMQSPEFIEKISNSLSSSLGVRIEPGPARIRLLQGLWLGPSSLHRPDAPPPNEESEPPLLNTIGLQVHYNPLALLRRQLEITNISLDQPILTYTQRADGSWWRWPARSNLPSGTGGPLDLEVYLNHIHLNGGALTITPSGGTPFFDASGINVTGSLVAREIGIASSGSVQVESIVLASHFALTSADAQINLQDDLLKLSDLRASAYGGTATGVIQFDFRTRNPEFAVDLELTDLDVPAMTQTLRDGPPWFEGRASASCQLKGSFAKPDLLQGTGSLRISEGRLSSPGLIAILAPFFPDADFPTSLFERIDARYKIGEKKITLYDLQAVSPDLRLTGTGTIGFNNQLDLDIRLSMSKPWIAKLAPEIAAAFTPSSDSFSSINFKLNGTLDRPTSNLIEKWATPAAAESPTPAAPLP